MVGCGHAGRLVTEHNIGFDIPSIAPLFPYLYFAHAKMHSNIAIRASHIYQIVPKPFSNITSNTTLALHGMPHSKLDEKYLKNDHGDASAQARDTTF